MENVRKNELIKFMNEFSAIYDVVRLVDPISTAVVELTDEGLQKTDNNDCFVVWDKEE